MLTKIKMTPQYVWTKRIQTGKISSVGRIKVENVTCWRMLQEGGEMYLRVRGFESRGRGKYCRFVDRFDDGGGKFLITRRW